MPPEMMYRDVAHAVHPHQLRNPFDPAAYPPPSGVGGGGDGGPPNRRRASPRQSQLHPSYPTRPSLHEAAHAVAVSHATRDERAAEHALKRKTPNAVLASGYDGTPVDWSLGPSANKHILMSKPEMARSAAYAHASAGYNAPAATNGFRSTAHLAPGATSWIYPSPSLSGTSQSNWHVQGQPPSLDSMLLQAPIAAYYTGNGYQSLPNVMQPMWNPNVGPTASGAPIPYGPYWPSGAFEPYRPAPMRDQRFNSQFANITLGDASEPLAPLDEPSSMAGVGYGRMNTMALSLSGVPSHPVRPVLSHFATDSFLSRRQGSNPALMLDGLQRHHSFTHQPPRTPSQPPHYFPRPSDSVAWPTNSSQNRRSRPLSQTNLQFRERTLVWAHKAYTDLLAAAQVARRSFPNGIHVSDRRNQQLPFYPKPPKYSSISPTTLKKALPEPISPRAADQPRPRQGHANEPYGYSPQWTPASATSARPMWGGSQQQSQARGQPLPDAAGVMPLANPMALSMPGVQPPAMQAQQALDMLSRLAAESGWQWIDGMLLGGCLAYGLGDHKSAHEWYSRVLMCDPHHVEGMSNLAATLAILGQFREAEQHWIQAVKLRPSYFEAVEHLIGLLCQDQRAREAVKVLDFVESSLRSNVSNPTPPAWEVPMLRGSSDSASADPDQHLGQLSLEAPPPPFSGYNISSSENGRLIALIHAKGNMLYSLGDNIGASRAFEDAIMIASGRSRRGIAGLIRYLLQVFARHITAQKDGATQLAPCETILLPPEVVLKTAEMAFPSGGVLPGFRDVPEGALRRAAISVASNSLLSLAKIYQDGMSSSSAPSQPTRAAPGVQDILALYYLSLSLQPSPSTANNVGILLAGVQQTAPTHIAHLSEANMPKVPGVAPGSGISLALAYYNYGLNLDNRHAHLYTNLGSLLKDIGQLSAAIRMYEQAVLCDGTFDIALANLANAVKDQGRISDAIVYYKRAVTANPDFAEAVCGLANALNSVCQWTGRGGIIFPQHFFDRWHVDDTGMLVDARNVPAMQSGWIGRVVAIVDKQLNEGKLWGKGVTQSAEFRRLLGPQKDSAISGQDAAVQEAVQQWSNDAGSEWEGARIVRLVERATRIKQWQLYRGKHVAHTMGASTTLVRPTLPTALAVPTAPTVLPFHTFTCPLNAAQIRKISQRNGLRISVSTLRAPWLSANVFEPPKPPAPHLNVGYVSSDFNNHPLAHLMQSVFGFHDTNKVRAFCYATTASDKSVHREQIQREAPVFYDASAWPVDRLVQQILDDNIHILVNLNGYTRGARNEVFAARPAPIQMSFMGFAGTLGAEWCDYLLADATAVPPSTLRPHRGNVSFDDLIHDQNYTSEAPQWVYGENLIFARDTFFCCDHRQSAPDAKEKPLSWADELERRRTMRRELFPELREDAIILGNFNQLYKIEPTTFRTWLRILQAVPEAVLWLLRFPELGEQNIRATAAQWASPAVANRIIFTDVAPKQEHIARARICDLFLDTPECNAHTTAADVLWSGTPLLTLPRYDYKMCSRMAASILKGALPRGPAGERAAADLIARDDVEYEAMATRLARGLARQRHDEGPECRLLELRRLLYEGRWTNALFDTRRWVRDLEEAYNIAWERWVDGRSGDIWL